MPSCLELTIRGNPKLFGDPNESSHRAVNRTMRVARMQNARKLKLLRTGNLNSPPHGVGLELLVLRIIFRYHHQQTFLGIQDTDVLTLGSPDPRHQAIARNCGVFLVSR